MRILANSYSLLIGACLILLGSCESRQAKGVYSSKEDKMIDWQGHRGARGLLPENSIPAFLKTLEYLQIQTLEMDVAVTKDSVIIVSHEPWMSHHICSRREGLPVTQEEEKELYLFQMTFEETQSFDCGSRGNERFPEQKPLEVQKPALSEVVEAVENFCLRNDRKKPFYNIEIKSKPDWDGERTPAPKIFAALLIKEIKRLNIYEQTCIQSFDPRALNAVHEIDGNLTTALLVDNIEGVEGNLRKVNFKPDIYSPHYKLVNKGVVKEVHEKGMKLIPWTVNDPSDMDALIKLGVDGIITDYPNKIPEY